MKKIAFYTLLCMLFSFTSCDMFKLDNKDAPEETLQGEVVDVATGEPVLTEQSGAGIRVRLLEVSWGENVTPQDFNCMPDGRFQNTKLFKARYNVRVDGPFIPIVREDTRGVPLADESKTLDISGVAKVKFEVQPFLKVELIGTPTFSNGKITTKVKVTRAVKDSIFRAKIEPMGNYSSTFLNVTDIRFLIGYTQSVGFDRKDGNGKTEASDDRWNSQISYTGSSFEPLLGDTLTIQSIGTIPSGRTVFIRALARINYDTPRGSGTRRYNYSEVKEVMIP